MPPRVKKPDELTVSFKVDGVLYVVRKSDLSPRIEMELPAGKSFAAAINTLREAAGAPVPWALAVLMFLSRRAQGEQVTFDQILDTVSYDMEIELADETGDSPEV